MRTSVSSRIRDAMLAQGVANPAELSRRIDLPRQTVHRWLNGDTKNMSVENLFRLADALNVSARWLALGDVEPSKYVIKNETEVEMMSIMKEMSPLTREQWLAIGRSLLAVQTGGRPTKVNPYASARLRKP